MFSVGEYVVCGNKGVCIVENITTLDIAGVDKDRKYYILKPDNRMGGTVFIPVDSPKESLRHILDKTEAEELLQKVAEIAPLEISNDKFAEQMYKDCLKSGESIETARVLKTIYERSKKRLNEGRKVTAVDAKYKHLAEDGLFGELAVSMQTTRTSVEEIFKDELNKSSLHLS